MHPFRGAPDPIDRVSCGRCGHPVWDHFRADTCAECERRSALDVCPGFTLAGFTELTPTASDAYVLQH